jgi:TonB family protein
LPYLLAGAAAAFALWSFEQQATDEPAPSISRPATNSAIDKRSGPNRARGDVRTVFSADDYPASAQRNGEQGTVQAQLVIDPTGRVSSCTIVESSNVASLDRTTCAILQRRARFFPAHDAGGRAISDSVTTPPIVWRLEG